MRLPHPGKQGADRLQSQLDAVLLQAQTERMAELGGPRYLSTEIDLLGPHILKLMQRAAAGNLADDGPLRTKDVTLLV